MRINKKDIIRLKKGLTIEFTEVGWIAKYEEKRQTVHSSSLILLDIFSKFISIEEGTKLMAEKCKLKVDFFKVGSDFHALLKTGFFEFKENIKNVFGFHKDKFDSFPVHVRMLNDKERTFAFQKAIRETVTANDVVLDIGTGNGVLAATAALCGAKQVYAVERTEFIEVARAVFKSNGLEDKIKLIKGDSKFIELPEKATILVTETIGNEAFDEGILATIEDAKKRLLTPNAKLIPELLEVYLQAVEIPKEKYTQSMVHSNNIQNWKNDYGVDFSAFKNYIDETPVLLGVNNFDLTNCKALSLPLKITSANFIENIKFNDEYELQIINEGCFNGIHVYFEATLSLGNILSLAHDKITKENNWKPKVFFLPKVKHVKKGESILLKYALDKNTSKISLQKEN